MPITATRAIGTLSWSDFAVVRPPLVDPADGHQVDAYTAFSWEFPDRPPQEIDGQLALNQNNVLRIRPSDGATPPGRPKVTRGTSQNAALLAHEQFHYDVGFVIARVVARNLMALRKPDRASMIAAIRQLTHYHFRTRARLIQSRYDIDSRHGTNSTYQRIWKQKMANCLANPNATKLGGFWL